MTNSLGRGFGEVRRSSEKFGEVRRSSGKFGEVQGYISETTPRRPLVRKSILGGRFSWRPISPLGSFGRTRLQNCRKRLFLRQPVQYDRDFSGIAQDLSGFIRIYQDLSGFIRIYHDFSGFLKIPQRYLGGGGYNELGC